MNGYMSDKLTFTNGLYPSPKYKKKLESFRIATTDAHYFIDDLFNMILLNIYIQKLKIRIVESAYITIVKTGILNQKIIYIIHIIIKIIRSKDSYYHI